MEGTHSSFFRIPGEIERVKRYLDSTIFAVESRGDNYLGQRVGRGVGCWLSREAGAALRSTNQSSKGLQASGEEVPYQRFCAILRSNTAASHAA